MRNGALLSSGQKASRKTQESFKSLNHSVREAFVKSPNSEEEEEEEA